MSALAASVASAPMSSTSVSGGSRRSSQQNSSAANGDAASAAAASAVSPVAAASVPPAHAHESSHAAASLSDHAAGSRDSSVPLEQLASGAFLTEAAWASDEQHKSQSDHDTDAHDAHNDAASAGEKEDQSVTEEDDSRVAKAEDEEEKERPYSSRSERDDSTEEKTSGLSSDSQALVVHSSPSKSPRKTQAVAKAPAPRRTHLFAYSALFGSSRTKIAAARSAKLASIEAEYDRAMMERTLEARHAQLVAEAQQEEAQRERDTQEAARRAQKQYARLHAAQLRLQAQTHAAETSITKREMESAAAERRRAAREEERRVATAEIRRKQDLRARAFVETHRSISSKWEEEESVALERFAADRSERLKASRAAQKDSGALSAACVEQLGLKDPVVVLHALGPHAVHQAVAPPPAAAATSGALAPRPPASGRKQAAASARGASHSARLPPMSSSASAAALAGESTSASSSPVRSSSSGLARTHSPSRLAAQQQMPTYGKGRPRHANPINAFEGARALAHVGTAKPPGRSRTLSPSSRGAPAAASTAAAAPDSASLPARPMSSRTRTAVGSGAAAAARARTAGLDDADDALATADTDAALAASIVRPASPVFRFWCTALECATALELPPALPLPPSVSAAALLSPAAASQARQEQEQAVEAVADAFRALFIMPAPPVEGTPAAGRCTVRDLLRKDGSKPAPSSIVAE